MKDFLDRYTFSLEAFGVAAVAAVPVWLSNAPDWASMSVFNIVYWTCLVRIRNRPPESVQVEE